LKFYLDEKRRKREFAPFHERKLVFHGEEELDVAVGLLQASENCASSACTDALVA
jgi:hypothetical protein